MGIILGNSGLGKTRLAEFYVSQTPRISRSVADKVPVVLVRCPTRFSESGFYAAILCALGAHVQTGVNANRLKLRLQELLLQHEVEIVLIDEIQDGIPQSGVKDRSQIIKSLKFLTDETDCAVLMLGICTAGTLYEHEEQIRSRCRNPFFVQPFAYTNKEDKTYWLQFLLRIFMDIRVPIPNSMDFGDRLMTATRGDLRNLERLIADLKHLYPEPPSTAEATTEALARVWSTCYYSSSLNQPNPFELDMAAVKDGLTQLNAALQTAGAPQHGNTDGHSRARS